MRILAELRLALRAQANATLSVLNDATPIFQDMPPFTRLYFNAKSIVEAAAQCIISAIELVDALVRHQEYHVSAALHTGPSILPPVRKGVVQSRLELEQHTSMLCAACDAFVRLLRDAPFSGSAGVDGLVRRLAELAKERMAAVEMFMRTSPLFVAGVEETELQ